jgi:hypothetical protein
MPIRSFLDGHKFDPETIRVMGLAFEMARQALRLADRTDLDNGAIAKRIIELEKVGVNYADKLCEGVLEAFRTGAGANIRSSPRSPTYRPDFLS